MLNKISAFIQQERLIQPGDTVICALSGGADSVALLFALYLLREKLGITLEAAHFNHQLRGEESQRDENFSLSLCRQFDIPLHLGSGQVEPGEKGLEAAAREARYSFFGTLPGKIATAHTADDNAETLLLHLIRGTGLKGLGGIAPSRGQLIRPMLTVTREEVMAFLEEYSLPHVEDSSNHTDTFLRNRIRRHVMPLLRQENPRLSENLSRTALQLRQEEEFLQLQCQFDTFPSVTALRAMPKAQRSRILGNFLRESGVMEPEERHISLAESLVFSQKPSARGQFPGGVTVARQYDTLAVLPKEEALPTLPLPCPGRVEISGFTVSCEAAVEIINTPTCFTVAAQGPMEIGSRREGDCIRLGGGTKSLKKVFIDRKIPASSRQNIPVIRDRKGILAVYSIGAAQDRAAKALPAVTIRLIKTEK